MIIFETIITVLGAIVSIATCIGAFWVMKQTKKENEENKEN